MSTVMWYGCCFCFYFSICKFFFSLHHYCYFFLFQFTFVSMRNISLFAYLCQIHTYTHFFLSILVSKLKCNDRKKSNVINYKKTILQLLMNRCVKSKWALDMKRKIIRMFFLLHFWYNISKLRQQQIFNCVVYDRLLL